MTDLQPNLFDQSPADPQPFDAAEVTARIAATARDNPYAEQEARAARIAEQREGVISVDAVDDTSAPAAAKPDGHDEFEPLKPEAAKIGLPAVRAVRKSIKQ